MSTTPHEIPYSEPHARGETKATDGPFLDDVRAAQEDAYRMGKGLELEAEARKIEADRRLREEVRGDQETRSFQLTHEHKEPAKVRKAVSVKTDGTVKKDADQIPKVTKRTPRRTPVLDAGTQPTRATESSESKNRDKTTTEHVRKGPVTARNIPRKRTTRKHT